MLQNGWVDFDDPVYVRDNPRVNGGLTPAGAIWFLHGSHGGNWHPLTSWSHQLDVTLFGLHPAGHHAVSLVLHVLNALLLVIVLHRMTGAWWRSVLVGALFALHPLRVESVAWISERKDVLSGLFFLLTLGAYARWTARPGPGRHAALIVLFALGLMSKPMLLTVPFLLLLLDVWPLGRAAPGKWPPAGAPPGTRPRPLPALLAEKWPLFALAVVSAVITLLVQRQAGATVLSEAFPFGQRATNALVSCWRYVGKMLWPAGLAPYYPYERGVGLPGAILAALGLAAVTAFVIHQLRKRPYLAVGWFWYLGMLVPVIGLIQVGGQSYADRYTYLPGIGLVAALVWSAGDLVGRSRPGRAAAAGIALLALAALGTATARQVTVWKDTATLFTHTITVTRNNAVAQLGLGRALLQAGKIKPALLHLEEAVRLAPSLPEAHNNLGSALGALGRHAEAIPQFEAMLRAVPDSPEAHSNLGISLAAMGRADEAITHFRAALRARDTAGIRQNLGITLERQGRTAEAIDEYRAALRMEPDRYPSLVRLGAALARTGRFAEADSLLRRALEMKPGDDEVRRTLEEIGRQGGRPPSGG